MCNARALLRSVYTGEFCRGNSMQFLSRLNCNFKIARVNQVRFSVRFVAAISQGFLTCSKLVATLARQKLHRVAATKIACVNGPLDCTLIIIEPTVDYGLHEICEFRRVLTSKNIQKFRLKVKWNSNFRK